MSPDDPEEGKKDTEGPEDPSDSKEEVVEEEKGDEGAAEAADDGEEKKDPSEDTEEGAEKEVEEVSEGDEKEEEDAEEQEEEEPEEEGPTVAELLECMTTRQPIVSILGHVDHGKTTILDSIRKTAVVDREAGKITQHIGATEVPLDTILERCRPLLGKQARFNVPGLLFIDTPGHRAFTTLRARGGALADLAVLVIDINEGLKPQTRESISILKRLKTPFVIAANKIDRISGWRSIKGASFMQSFREQSPRIAEELDMKIYKLIEVLGREGVNADRYDRVEDFSKTFAIVPMSAREDEGINDLLLVLTGLAQRFLEQHLQSEEGPAKATVLEVKEEKGLGKTLDLIVYSGTLRRSDRVAIGTQGKPIVTKVKALLKPKPLDEIRDPRERFESVDCVTAAAGIKVSAQNLEGVISGAPFRVVPKGQESDIKRALTKEMEVNIEFDDEGLMVKADAVGSLEALAFEMREAKIPIKIGLVGPITKREVTDVSTISDQTHQVILGFNVKPTPDAQEQANELGVKIILADIIYKLVEEYQEWLEVRKKELDASSRGEIIYPGMFRILPDYVFNRKDPVIVGVRVLNGRIRVGQRLIREDGLEVGRIKSIRSGQESMKEARMGAEVALAISGPTLGRQIKVEDILYVNIPEGDVKKLKEVGLSADEEDCLEKIMKIKRKEKPFWGM
jgi:translation initiation factor 5B